MSDASEKADEKSETFRLAFRLQVFLCEVLHVFLQFWSFQYLDVIGKSHVETTDSLKLVDLGVEIPDVVITLVGLDEAFR